MTKENLTMTVKERQLLKVIALVVDYLNEHEFNGFLRAVNNGMVPELTLLEVARAYGNDTFDLDYMMKAIRKYKERYGLL